MTKKRILFIGGGNMTQALVSGLIANNYSADKLTVVDRHAEKRELLASQFKINVAAELATNIGDADIIVLAIKPQSAKAACLQLRPFLKNKKPLILSVMAGITIQTLTSWLGEFPLVRAMPNTPALVKTGATGIFADSKVNQEQKLQIEALVSSIGISAWLENETQIDAITALSGSGPAYFFLMMEAMQNAAIELGLPEKIAKQFAIQTAHGASALAQSSEQSLANLRNNVTSKGGTTEAAITVFEQRHFSELVKIAMKAAKERAEILSREI